MRKRALPFALVLLAPRVALAQEPVEPPAKHEPVEVRVIGDRGDSLQKTPGSVTLVTSQDIARADPQDAAEMLRRVPGVQVRQEYSSGMRLDIGIRGNDPGRSRQVLVLEDGIPVAVNPYGEPDIFYMLPIERVRGIEVVKGSGNILFGPRTVGGVINFLTLTPPSRPHAVLETEAGTLGYLKELASYGDSIGPARYVVQFVRKRGDGIRHEPFESTDVFGKIAFDTSDKGEATLKLGFHDDSAVSPDVGLTRQMFATDPARSTSLAQADLAQMRRYEVSLIHEQRFSDKTKLRTLLYAYTNTRFWRREQFDRTPTMGTSYDRVEGDTTVPGSALYFKGINTIQDWVYEVAGVEPRIEHHFSTGPLDHTLETGARILGETTSYQLRNGDNPTAVAGTLQGAEQNHTLALAGYVQDRVVIRESFVITPGIRIEHAAFHQLLLRQTDTTGSHDVSVAGDTQATGVIPGLGMVYGGRAANVFAGVHYGWGPPRVAEAFGANGVPTQVAAEESINWELGFRAAPKQLPVRGEVTGFYSTFTNQVVSGTADTGNATLVNGGPTKHIGVEAAAVLGIGKALKWPTIVDLGARYTFARATFSEGAYAGYLVPYAPQHTVSTNLDIEHPTGFGGQVAYLHVSSQFSDFPNTLLENSTGEYGLMPAYDVVDATAHYRHKPTHLTIKLTLKNGLNMPYVAARRPQGIDPAGFRQIMVGLRWDWEAALATERPQ